MGNHEQDVDVMCVGAPPVVKPKCVHVCTCACHIRAEDSHTLACCLPCGSCGENISLDHLDAHLDECHS